MPTRSMPPKWGRAVPRSGGFTPSRDCIPRRSEYKKRVGRGKGAARLSSDGRAAFPLLFGRVSRLPALSSGVPADQDMGGDPGGDLLEEPMVGFAVHPELAHLARPGTRSERVGAALRPGSPAAGPSTRWPSSRKAIPAQSIVGSSARAAVTPRRTSSGSPPRSRMRSTSSSRRVLTSPDPRLRTPARPRGSDQGSASACALSDRRARWSGPP